MASTEVPSEVPSLSLTQFNRLFSLERNCYSEHITNLTGQGETNEEKCEGKVSPVMLN